MKRLIFTTILLFGYESYGIETVSSCVSKVTSRFTMSVTKAEAERACKQASPKEINCAIELYAGKKMSLSWAQAVEECNRPTDFESN